MEGTREILFRKLILSRMYLEWYFIFQQRMEGADTYVLGPELRTYMQRWCLNRGHTPWKIKPNLDKDAFNNSIPHLSAYWIAWKCSVSTFSRRMATKAHASRKGSWSLANSVSLEYRKLIPFLCSCRWSRGEWISWNLPTMNGWYQQGLNVKYRSSTLILHFVFLLRSCTALVWFCKIMPWIVFSFSSFLKSVILFVSNTNVEKAIFSSSDESYRTVRRNSKTETTCWD